MFRDHSKKPWTETAVQGAVSMVNNIPYTNVGLNQSLMCPSDILTPWKVPSASSPPDVQELPESGLQTLLDARKAMCVKQHKMREIQMEELRTNVDRFKSGRLKLGSNKSSPQIEPGGIVLVELGSKPPQLGVVLSMTQRDATIRFREGDTSLALGQCVPITPSNRMLGSRQ